MKTLNNVQVTIRGMDLTVKDIEIGSADRDVGIMCDYVESCTLWNNDGVEVQIYDTLTDDEINTIDNAIYESIEDDNDYGPDEAQEWHDYDPDC